MESNKNYKYKLILSPVKSKINLAFFLSCISCIFKVSNYILLIYIINSLIYHNNKFPLHLIIYLIIFSLSNYIIKLFANEISHKCGYNLEEILREKLITHISKLPLGFLIEKGSGYIVKVLQDDVKELHAYVADAPPLKAEAFFSPLLIIVTLIFFNWKLSLCLFLVMFLIFIMLFILMIKNIPLQKEYSKSLAKINSTIIEFIQAMPIIRTFDSGEKSFSRYQDALNNYKDILQKWNKKYGIYSKILTNLLTPMLVTLLIIILGMLWFEHFNLYFDFITFFAFLLLGCEVIESIAPYIGLMNHLEKSNKSIDCIYEILTTPTLPISKKSFNPTKYNVSFNNVNFKYDKQDAYVLKNLSFKIKEKSFTAIVGSSGSGKTTVVNLIARFWDVTSGSIEIGGINIKDISYDNLSKMISFVLQDNFLFSCSIAQNICYGVDNVSEEEMFHAAKLAQIHDFIINLPDKYQTLAGDRGINLSSGQRQRITIARAILQKRPILILDEPTSFSDLKNEQSIIKSLINLMQNKIIIIVAHRLSTIKNADQILVFDNGVIIEQGNHNNLLKLKGVYNKLWNDSLCALKWNIDINDI